jgi:hypothetical protein
LVVVARIQLAIFIGTPAEKLILLRTQTKYRVSAHINFTYQRNFVDFLELLSESCSRHVSSQLTVKVLSESEDFAFLGQKDTELITEFAINERSLFFHEIFVDSFGDIDVMLAKLTPNEKLIVFGDCNRTRQA